MRRSPPHKDPWHQAAMGTHHAAPLWGPVLPHAWLWVPGVGGGGLREAAAIPWAQRGRAQHWHPPDAMCHLSPRVPAAVPTSGLQCGAKNTRCCHSCDISLCHPLSNLLGTVHLLPDVTAGTGDGGLRGRVWHSRTQGWPSLLPRPLRDRCAPCLWLLQDISAGTTALTPVSPRAGATCQGTRTVHGNGASQSRSVWGSVWGSNASTQPFAWAPSSPPCSPPSQSADPRAVFPHGCPTAGGSGDGRSLPAPQLPLA